MRNDTEGESLFRKLFIFLLLRTERIGGNLILLPRRVKVSLVAS